MRKRKRIKIPVSVGDGPYLIKDRIVQHGGLICRRSKMRNANGFYVQ